MAEPIVSSVSSSRPARPRLPHIVPLREPSRESLDDTFDLGGSRRPAPVPLRTVEPEPRSPEAEARAAEHASAERMLRGALLVGLLLNLAVFLGIGLSLPLGPLTRADALLAAVTLLAAVAMLALGELCRRGEPPSSKR